MGKYFFTFIIFNDKLEKLDLTLEGLYQCLKKSRIDAQVIIADDDGTAEQCKYMEQMRDFGIKLDCFLLTEENRGEILERALEQAEGEYINITKSGVLYQGSVLDKVCRYAKQTKEDRILVPAVSNLMSATMREINAFQKKYGDKTDLENNYHLVHCNYYAYFIRKDAFSKEPGIDQDWRLAVLKKMFYTLTSHPKIGYVKKGEISALSGQEVVSHWLNMLKEGESDRFCRNFLQEIFTYCKSHPEICVKNAKYNLVFYCGMLLARYVSDEHVQEIRDLIEEIFQYLEDEEILLFNQYLNREHKYYLEKKLSWKSQNRKDVEARRREVLDQSHAGTTYQFIQVKPQSIVIECRTMLFMQDEFQVFFQINSQRYPGELQEKEEIREWFGEKICQVNYVKCEFPVCQGKEYRVKIICVADGKEIEKKSYVFGPFMPLSNEVELYYQENGWSVFYDTAGSALVISPKTKGQTMKLRWRRTLSLLKKNNASRKSYIVRIIMGFYQIWKRKEIWLVSDRTNRADDNGEIFFQYVCKERPENVKPYFVIAKESSDFERMKQYGKVIPVYSWKHKILHLLSDYVVSSQANKPVMNPFGRVGYCYKDIIAKKKIVFLQHGVIKDDLSGWLNRYNRNLYGFVVTTKPEYDSILDYDYYYTPKEVWLTGIPRHDALYHDEKKYITIMPTWRKTLSGGTDASGVWQIGDDFTESSYFKFYNDLLNHEQLLSEAKKYGYQICFMPHPNVKSALGLFEHHPDVIFWDETKAYREVFAESDLLVTDYSSVVFDFAYLRKPILYCQFDREEFFSGGHSYVEGYYNYLEDGFGEVEEDLAGIVERMIEYMAHGCVLKEKYSRRIDRTFAYHDKECCKRVVDKIQGKTISEIRET